MKYITIARWLAVIWTIIMLIGCLAPHADIPGPLISLNDKLQHSIIFVLFAFLWMEAGLRLNTVLLIGILFGGLIEVLQYLLPINRNADWADFAADTLGTVIGVGLAFAWARLYPNHRF